MRDFQSEIDPQKFAVPVAVNADGEWFQIEDTKPKTKGLLCPVCDHTVTFVSEAINGRAAHFRHEDRGECDALVRHHRQTIHDVMCAATERLLNVRGYHSDALLTGASGLVVSRGKAVREVASGYDGKRYIPDVTVNNRDGEGRAILELEIVYSHKPEGERVNAAARNNRVIAVLNVARFEREYYLSLYARTIFDLPEMAEEYILASRFKVMNASDVARVIVGKTKRKYISAKPVTTCRNGIDEPEEIIADDTIWTCKYTGNVILDGDGKPATYGEFPHGFAVGGFPKSALGGVFNFSDYWALSPKIRGQKRHQNGGA